MDRLVDDLWQRLVLTHLSWRLLVSVGDKRLCWLWIISEDILNRVRFDSSSQSRVSNGFVRVETTDFQWVVHVDSWQTHPVFENDLLINRHHHVGTWRILLYVHID